MDLSKIQMHFFVTFGVNSLVIILETIELRQKHQLNT